MAVLENKTAFAAELFTTLDSRGSTFVILAVRGTFDIDERGTLHASVPQEPVNSDDVYCGEPGKSSLKFASDFVAAKAGTDVALIGTAYAPDNRPVREMVVGLSIGPVRKTVTVFGDRVWSRRLGVATVGRPEPFLELPLVYERAFGGMDTTHADPGKHDWEHRNPVGRGYRTHKAVAGLLLPNIESSQKPIVTPSDRPAPQGFGFIDRMWEPRSGFAGTYDDAWQRDQCPLLPLDFDLRHFQAAHPDLVCRPHLQGDEPVRIVGAVREGVLDFRLPSIAIGITVEFRSGRPRPGAALLDTVVLRPDERKVTLVWRAAVRCPRKVFDVEVVTAFALPLGTARRLIPGLRNPVHTSGTDFGKTTW